MIEELTDMGELTEDLGFLLARVSGEVVRATNAALAEDGLRVRHYAVLLLACDSRRGVSQRAMARILGLDPSQVVALVDELAQAGLVERQPAPTDRRAKLVTATEAGHRKRERAAVRAADAVRGVLEPLSAGEQATLRALLSRAAGVAGHSE
jgi:MarR family transcriptional regulator, organic hydroperoxide resistance regulator